MKTSFLEYFFNAWKTALEKNWYEKPESNSRFLEYKLLKQRFGLEEYKCTMKGNFRDALPNFRAGVFWGKVHRFCFTLGSDTASSFCPDQKEDEVHVLCECTKQENMRPDFWRRESLHMRNVYRPVLSTSNPWIFFFFFWFGCCCFFGRLHCFLLGQWKWYS